MDVLKRIGVNLDIPGIKKRRKAEVIKALENAEKIPPLKTILIRGPQKPVETNIQLKFTTLEKMFQKAQGTINQGIDNVQEFIDKVGHKTIYKKKNKS